MFPLKGMFDGFHVNGRASPVKSSWGKSKWIPELREGSWDLLELNYSNSQKVWLQEHLQKMAPPMSTLYKSTCS